MTMLTRQRLAEEFDPIDESERDTLTFAYAESLASGETVQSATVTVEVIEGTDATPEQLLNGALSVSGGVDVLQPIKGRPAGVRYAVRCVAVTSAARHLTTAGTIRSIRLGSA